MVNSKQGIETGDPRDYLNLPRGDLATRPASADLTTALLGAYAHKP